MEPALTLSTSNRLEVLVDRLADVVAESPLPPLEREIVVVQSQGMQRWLTLQLARKHGISGGLTTPYPRLFAAWAAARVLDGDTDLYPLNEEIEKKKPGPFDREILTWRIFQLLERSEEADTAGRISEALAYLETDPDQRKRLQLAVRLAGLFDDYQVFRPDLLDRWQSGVETPDSPFEEGTEAWQSELWRQLTTDGSYDPEAPLHRRIARLISHLEGPEDPLPGLPSRVSVLGVSSLPPLFLDLLAALSRRLPVAIYFVSPTYHYWGDLRSERETSRLARRLRLRPEELLVEQHYQEGHPLLAALGRQGRDFFNLLQRLDDSGAAWQELEFVDPAKDFVEDSGDGDGPATALATLQHDILHLVDREPDDTPILDPEDRSLEVHACHSPLREMQVLRDRLLDAFERDPYLRPGDVLVQVPDIELYGPYIQAVFGVDHQDTPRLPFSIADRRAGREQPPSETFLDVLDLSGERLTVRQVFDLLDTPAIRRRFELGLDELPTLRRLMDAVRVRWGMDGRQKARDYDLPAWDANTWRAGLDRLLMGYGVGPAEPGEFPLPAGIAPHAGDTAGSADAVGRFAAYVDRLFGVLRSLGPRRTLQQWSAVGLGALDVLFAAEGEAEERGLQRVRDVLHELAELAAGLELEEPVALRVVRDHLASQLEASGFGSGFIDGRITFCELKPMRTIPFRVICIAGLDDGAFPRQDRRRSFDLVAADPRPGDRSLRDDDRYLFLETLLAARRRLLLTYVGRSQKDSSRREPSVVLAELLDQLDRTFRTDGPLAPRDLVTTEHRLQAWSPRHFQGPETGPLWSYSREDLRAARALRSPQQDVPPFVPGDLPEVEDQLLGRHGLFELELPLEDLERFWQLPCRYFVERSLRIRLEDDLAAAAESEPFLMTGVEAFELRRRLLERRLAARASDAEDDDDADASAAEELELRRLVAEGRLPAFELGEHQWREQRRRVAAFLERLPALEALPPRTLDLRLDDEDLTFRLTGTLRPYRIDGTPRLAIFRCGRLRPRDLLGAWIDLLAAALDARGREAEPLTAILVGEDATVRLRPPIDAETRLEELLQGFRRGLGRPLPFFPDTSRAFVEQEAKLADPRNPARATAEDRARRVFSGDALPRKDAPPAESTDPYVRLAFRGAEPLDDPDFAVLARRVWQPALDHATEVQP